MTNTNSNLTANQRKAKEGLALLKEAIIATVQANPGIYSSAIGEALAIQSAAQNGSSKNWFIKILLDHCSGEFNPEYTGAALQSLASGEKIKSRKEGATKCWYPADK